jgi:hypothetical protein
MLIPFGILSASASGGVVGDYELIESAILTSNESSVTFSNLGTYSSTYKHLQIRAVGRGTRDVASEVVLARFNSDSTSSYSAHDLFGNGSSVASSASTSQTSIFGFYISGAPATANAFGGAVFEILDPYSTSKNTTTRAISGNATGIVVLNSGAFLKTNSITTIQLFPFSGDFVSGSRFSLYGIK